MTNEYKNSTRLTDAIILRHSLFSITFDKDNRAFTKSKFRVRQFHSNFGHVCGKASVTLVRGAWCVVRWEREQCVVRSAWCDRPIIVPLSSCPITIMSYSSHTSHSTTTGLRSHPPFLQTTTQIGRPSFTDVLPWNGKESVKLGGSIISFREPYLC